jgi:hypothetical protein
LIIIGIVTPMLLDLNRYHGFIVSEVEKAVGGKVKLGRISWGITHRIWLDIDGFSIIDASAFPGEVKLTRIYTSVSMPRLLAKKVVLKNLRLESSEVKFRLEPATKETGPPADGTKSTGFHLPVEIEIQQLAVAIKRLELDDAFSLSGQTLVHVFSDVDLTATNIAPAKAMAFNLALRDKSPSGLGTLKAQGTFRGLTKTLTLENPDIKLKAILEEFHVDAIKPYLKNSQLKNQLSGTISMEANCEGDPAKNLNARGVIDLSSMTYKDPSRWEAALPGQKTTIAFQINLDPQNLTAEKISLKLGSLSLDARAELHGWKKDPVITDAELSSDLPLLDMIPLIPWKMLGNNADVIRSILQGGGKIVLNKVVFPEIRLAKLPATVNDLLSEIEMTAQVAGVSVQPSPNMPKIEDITGRVSLQNNMLIAENIHSRLGPIALPTLNIQVTDIAAEPKGTIRVKGPLQVAASGDAQIEKLLMQHGLKRLTGSADVDMRADFDQRRPKDWTANGSLVLQEIRVQSHPANVVLENLEGAVKFNRKKVINITAQDLSAQINQASVKMTGRFTNVGAPNMLISTKAYAEQLDLSHLAEFIPTLKDLKLSGKLSMNLDAHVPYAAPVKSRLTGTLTTRNVGFQLAAAGLAVENGDTQIVLAGDSAKIKAMTLHVNDQKLALSGQLSNPVKPNAKLLITSPDLNLDRLLPPDKAAKPSSTPSDQSAKKPATGRKAGKAELPPVARKLTADLKVQAGRGQYKGLQFEKLKLNLLYKQGVIESYDVNFGIGKGHIASKGSADLRDLDRIRFTVDPNISALPLETVTPALGIDNLPLNGPLTLKGQLRGITGSTKEILGGLNGKLDASLGPGNLNKVGKAGDFIAKLSSMAHISSLFSGRLFKDFSSRGIPFETITAQTSFGKGTLNLNKLHFGSDAMTVDGQGKIDLINQNLNMEALLVPLATVDKTLHYVPIVGKALEDVTKIQIDVEGPLEDPKIHTAEAREIGKGIETEVNKPKTILQDVGKGLKEIF